MPVNNQFFRLGANSVVLDCISNIHQNYRNPSNDHAYVGHTLTLFNQEVYNGMEPSKYIKEWDHLTISKMSNPPRKQTIKMAAPSK